MNLSIEGKKALVTGGSHGIGLAIKQGLKEEGVQVYSISRREGYDVLRNDDMERATEQYKEIDILVNNVGGGGRWGTIPYHQTYYKVWDEVYRKNAKACYLLTCNSLPYMMEKQWGRVITIASVFGKEGGGRPWFVAAKAAEIAMMKSFALDKSYQQHNITFNTVAPGAIYIPDKEMDDYEKYGDVKDVANLVVFLCSNRARWINGACIVIDGGFSKSF